MKTDLELLHAYMHEKGLSQEGLAQQLKITRQTVHNTILRAKANSGILPDSFKMRLMLFNIDLGGNTNEPDGMYVSEPQAVYERITQNERIAKLEAANKILMQELARLIAVTLNANALDCFVELEKKVVNETKDIA